MTRDCEPLGLTTSQRQRLVRSGDFPITAVRTLAHLREAWCVADPQNRHQVEGAIRALLLCHSLREIPEIVMAVLTHGLGRADATALMAQLDPGKQNGATPA